MQFICLSRTIILCRFYLFFYTTKTILLKMTIEICSRTIVERNAEQRTHDCATLESVWLNNHHHHKICDCSFLFVLNKIRFYLIKKMSEESYDDRPMFLSQKG